MEITILTFGHIADITGSSSMSITDVNDTDEVQRKLGILFPALGTSTYSLALNKSIIHSKAMLHHGDVVALLPPFSGG